MGVATPAVLQAELDAADRDFELRTGQVLEINAPDGDSALTSALVGLGSPVEGLLTSPLGVRSLSREASLAQRAALVRLVVADRHDLLPFALDEDAQFFLGRRTTLLL